MATQADYLTRAYAYAKRFPQVKMLLWFLVDDNSPSGEAGDYSGFYTGLCDLLGNKKPAWYAFAADTQLTVAGPTSATPGQSVRLSGVLSSATFGTLAGKVLTLQGHAAGKPWAKVTTTKTSSRGVYGFKVSSPVTNTYRVVWPGVVTSKSLSVARL